MGKQSRIQYGFLPGAERRENSVFFCTSVQKGDFCRLILCPKKKEAKKKSVNMERAGQSRVFTAELPSEHLREYEAYYFEDAKGKFEDVYAKALTGRESFGMRQEEHALIPPMQDDFENMAGFVCPAFSSLIFYKLHVRGFTKSGSVSAGKRGTFAGLKEKIPYLKELGINAVLLMPVYEFDECMKESVLGVLPAETMAEYEKRYGSDFVKAQLEYETNPQMTAMKVNYWGYTESNYYFAPKASYASNPKNAPKELTECVNALHAAGIAVFFEMYFGRNTKHSLMAECLRYWTFTFGADGFRLIGEALPMQLFLDDPYLAGVKFLVTTESEAMQDCPQAFDERRCAVYNDAFKVAMRRFIKGDENTIPEFTARLCGENDKFAKMHYIADQNGFSLYDLYAYDRKHNEENGEDNKDGDDYNYSWNCGTEGDTSKKKILALRAQLRKNALCSVLLSRGVPMLFAGDEFGHTQKGNNNAYCQDNEVSWLNWRKNKERREQYEFTRQLIAFRREHELLEGGRLLTSEDPKKLGFPEVSYHGVSLWQPDFAPYSRTVAVLFCGGYAKNGKKEDVFLLFNMHWEEHSFGLPGQNGKGDGSEWSIALDTSLKASVRMKEDLRSFAVSADPSLTEWVCAVPPRSIVVLVRKEAQPCSPENQKN